MLKKTLRKTPFKTIIYIELLIWSSHTHRARSNVLKCKQHMTNLVSGEEALEKFRIDCHVGPSERGGCGCKGLIGVHVEIRYGV